MSHKLLHAMLAPGLSGFAAMTLASDSDFITDEIQGMRSDCASFGSGGS